MALVAFDAACVGHWCIIITQMNPDLPPPAALQLAATHLTAKWYVAKMSRRILRSSNHKRHAATRRQHARRERARLRAQIPRPASTEFFAWELLAASEKQSVQIRNRPVACKQAPPDRRRGASDANIDNNDNEDNGNVNNTHINDNHDNEDSASIDNTVNIPNDDTSISNDNTSISDHNTSIPNDPTSISDHNTNTPNDSTNISNDNTNIANDNDERHNADRESHNNGHSDDHNNDHNFHHNTGHNNDHNTALSTDDDSESDCHPTLVSSSESESPPQRREAEYP